MIEFTYMVVTCLYNYTISMVIYDNISISTSSTVQYSNERNNVYKVKYKICENKICVIY